LFDIHAEFIEIIKSEATEWLGKGAEQVLWVNCEPPSAPVLL
jgi:hypothetical protein